MAKLNVKPVGPPPPMTHEGAPAVRVNALKELRRTVLACMLWEASFYEDGVDVADRIGELVAEIAKKNPQQVANLAIEAREKMKLRHVPLLIVRELARIHNGDSLVSNTLEKVIQRPDELCEFLAIYWAEEKCPLSAQVKKGLAKAFNKFNAYSLAKYNQDRVIKLRDTLFLCHAKPKDPEQDATWKKLVDKILEPPDTWEVALSSGANKKESWTRLLSENKLGVLALIRNLRNMEQVGVEEDLVLATLQKASVERALPYRFITAARYAPRWEPALEDLMFKALGDVEKLPGKTCLLVDVSGSMNAPMSGRSEATREDAANGLAILAREMCESVTIASFSQDTVMVPPRRGFALRDAIHGSQSHGCTYLGAAVKNVLNGRLGAFDRLIVFTDEQSHDPVPDPPAGLKAYMVNVAGYQNGVGYGAWTHIDGFSEAILHYIRESEKGLD